MSEPKAERSSKASAPSRRARARTGLPDAMTPVTEAMVGQKITFVGKGGGVAVTRPRVGDVGKPLFAAGRVPLTPSERLIAESARPNRAVKKGRASRRGVAKAPRAGVTSASTGPDKRVKAVIKTVGQDAAQHFLSIRNLSTPVLVGSDLERLLVEFANVQGAAYEAGLPSGALGSWLLGSEPVLDGARPIDVLATQGAEPLEQALLAFRSGAYA